MEAGTTLGASYADPAPDLVREELEVPWLAQLADRVLDRRAGARVLELGCGSGLGPALAAGRALDYTGLDVRAPGFDLPGPHVTHDLRDGLGPVGPVPFDLYLAGFGLASHLSPSELSRLLADIAAHGQPGSMVVIEALGLHSLEWPRLWSTTAGPERRITYAMERDVGVHPWAPAELARLTLRAGLRPLRALDRTIQAGPKLGDYWPALPDLRGGLRALIGGATGHPALTERLPPLPAGPAAARHQAFARRRQRLAQRHTGEDLARRIWLLERGSGGGFGHGLVLIARVP